MSNVVIAGRGHCCDPFSALKEEIDMAVTIAMNARNIAEEALASTGAGASDNNPLALDDTASPGSAMEWSRSDHVHPNTGLLEPDDVTAGDNIEVTDNGDGTVTIALKADQVRVGNTILTGNVTITGNITQNGASYETHAEKVYTTNDYIITRDGATGALGSGDYSGFQVKLYDGVNDGRLVIDNAGTARVGDVGDEQPLMTRDESADLTDGDSLIWDAANSKAITAAIPSAISTALAGKQDTLIPLFSNFSENLTSGVPVYDLGSITASKTGIMILSIAGAFANNSDGYRLIGFSRNSTSIQENWLFNTNTNADALYFSVTVMIPVTQGDVIRTCAYQTSSSTIGVSGAMRAIVI